MQKVLNLFDFKQKVAYKTEILAGLTVAMTMIPESLSFAILAGFPPLVGLYGAFIMGIITAIFGGRPGLISGGAGATVIVLIAPENLMYEMKKVHQFLVFSVNSFSQHAIAEYLDVVDFSEVSKMYQKKRDLFQGLLKNSRFELMPCDGTYFQVVNYNAISKENDVEFAKKLITKFGVAAIPISVFYEDATDKHMLRFCFAKTDETLIAAAEKLCLL
uniref:aminotransferase class I/II-fold pyridoxal phosphate-dependent enzyme n=1 Tax=Flavobacterium sp. TaxID=239 RepID=UPI0040484781